MAKHDRHLIEWSFLLGIWVWLSIAPVQALEIAMPRDGMANLARAVEYLEDPDHKLTIEDMHRGQLDQRFTRYSGIGDINFGLTDSAYWLRFRLQSNDPDQRNYLLELAYFGLINVALYSPGGDVQTSGYFVPIEQRSWPHSHFVFPIELSAEQAKTYYLRVQSNGSLTVPLYVWEPQAFTAQDRPEVMANVLYFGILLGLLCYNAFLFASLRERSYGLYCAFLIFTAGAMLAYTGLRVYTPMMHPNWPSVLGVNALFCFAGIFAILFLRDFLNLPTQQRISNHVLLMLVGVLLFIALSPWFNIPMIVTSWLLNVVAVFVGPSLLLVSFVSWRRGHPGARYLLLAWSVLLVAVAVQALRNVGVVPTNLLTRNLLLVGSVLDMLLLSFALADRIHSERAARAQAQHKALEAEQARVNALKASEQRLEITVAERTEDLGAALTRERDTLRQYVEFARLISHEFRNPLAVIKSQASVAMMEYARGVGQPVKRFQAVSEAAGRLQGLFEQWLDSDRLSRGTQELRIRRIELADWLPRLFGPSNTRTGHVITVIVREHVEIEVDEALVGMALQNLVDNAAKYSRGDKPIEVEAHVSATEVGIAVRDYGVGMSPSVRQRVFEKHYRAPNNTTAWGMGLGLFLVRQVVEAHHGRIDVVSELGEGTTFTLWLPRALSASSPENAVPEERENARDAT